LQGQVKNTPFYKQLTLAGSGEKHTILSTFDPCRVRWNTQPNFYLLLKNPEGI